MPGSSKKWLSLAGALVLSAALPAWGEEQEHGHAHGHGAPASESGTTEPEAHPPGHDHGAPQEPTGEEGHKGHGHEGHDGESPSMESSPAPVAVPPEQPAKTLQPDALDAPAATSVVDAQRSAQMAREMEGGHGGHGGHGNHGVARYRHVDVGRGPEAYLEEDQPPGAGSGSEHHEHGSTADDHSGHGVQEVAGLYLCPMHPEVTSETPGTCSKCGMALVQRRKE